MRNIVLFDRPDIKTNLLPLSYTRPLCDLRVGITTIREKWETVLPGQYSTLTDPYLSEKYPATVSPDTLFIASNIFPSGDLTEALTALQPGQAIADADGSTIAFRGGSFTPGTNIESAAPAPCPVDSIVQLYDIFLKNGSYVTDDFFRLTSGRSSMPIDPSVTVIGDSSLVFIEEGAKVQGAFINTTGGPVYVGCDAEIMEGSCLRSPVALCRHSVVNMGTKIYGGTTIGPWCKVGGELNNVVMIGYSNKAHDGFLGNAVIGEWCNLGAGCVASNLKNDYTEIKLWNYSVRRFARTGLQFCGLMMGDHSKAGINTMFNTATVLGVGVNVYGSGFQRNFLASFSEGSRQGFTDVPMSKFFEIARRVMARRGCEFTEADERIFNHINEMAHSLKF